MTVPLNWIAFVFAQAGLVQCIADPLVVTSAYLLYNVFPIDGPGIKSKPAKTEIL